MTLATSNALNTPFRKFYAVPKINHGSPQHVSQIRPSDPGNGKLPRIRKPALFHQTTLMAVGRETSRTHIQQQASVAMTLTIVHNIMDGSSADTGRLSE